MRQKKYPISKKNQDEIKQFLDSLKANSTPDDDTIRNYETSIRRVLYTIDRDRKRITESDLDKVFSNINNSGTKELIKMKFKAYLKYWKMTKLADHIKINSNYFKNARKTANDVLTKEEIEQIRNSPNSNRDLAIFELFITSGICREELSLLLNQNIIIAEDEIKVEIVKGKTPNRPRTIHIIPYPNNPCAFYPNQFVSYFRNHPFKDKKDFPLFFSTDFRKPNQPFECHALNQIIHKVRKKAGISKKVTPHILRHTCATHDGYQNNEGFLQMKFGWKNPDMAQTYCHLKEEQVYDTLRHKAGLTPQFVEIESKCPFCGHRNNINDKTCANCQRTVSKEEMAKQHQLQEEREQNWKNIMENQDKKILALEKDSNVNIALFYHLWYCVNNPYNIQTEDGRIIDGKKNPDEFINQRDNNFIRIMRSWKDDEGKPIFVDNTIQAFRTKLLDFRTLTVSQNK